MLGKCLKYDVKSIFGIWWIAAVTVLLLSVGAGLCVRFFLTAEDMRVFLAVLGFMLFYLAALAFLIITEILVYVRYYQNFFRDEGYLTFTLPVKRETLFLSKVLNGVIWTAASVAVLGVCIAVILAIVPPEILQKAGLDWNVLTEDLGILWKGITSLGGWGYVYAAEVVLGICLYGLESLLAIYLCITLGAVVAKKHKVLASVGFIYGFQWVMSMVSFAVMICLMIMAFTLESVFPNPLVNPYGEAIVALLGLLICIILAVVNAVLAFVNIGCLERKLNLA